MDYLLLIIPLVSILLLFVTFLILGNHKSFWKFFFIHAGILLLYVFLIFFLPNNLIGHDEYGLRQLGVIITLILLHIIIGFIHSLYILKKTGRK